MRQQKIKEALSPELIAEYEKYLIDAPSASVDSRVTWLAAHGHKISRNAVWRHQKTFARGYQFPIEAAKLARAFQNAGMRCRMLINPESRTMEIELSGSSIPQQDMRKNRHLKVD